MFAKSIFIVMLPFLAFFSNGLHQSLTGVNQPTRSDDSGILEKLIVAEGTVTMDLDAKLYGRSGAKGAKQSVLRFDVERDAFFTVIVFNEELRAPLPSAMSLIAQNTTVLPGKLNESQHRLAIESTPIGSPYSLIVRDAKTGFTFFNIEGQELNYSPEGRKLNIQLGRMLMSKEFATELGRPAEAGSFVGEISIKATMRPIEVTVMDGGEVTRDSMPAMGDPAAGGVPGPDVIVGDLSGLAQFGSAANGFVGLAVGTDSCNAGTTELNWLASPNNDHPVIPQNIYRMSGGASNDARFEQIGQSNVKHAFTALQHNLCGFGCQSSGTGSRLGRGCSDPYEASLNAGPNLGSRAWINPFTGSYPRGDSATPPNSHSGHSHNGTSHRILTAINDLRTDLNPGATYYAEAQYVTPHEYNWCQANPGQCNMYNNVSYRRYNVNGTAAPFSFAAAAPTERMKRAVTAWPGATIVEIRPDPGQDGIGAVAYKVTNPSPGVWHYEYAIFNENLDRAIQMFGIPVNAQASVTNIGFHAPPQHPGYPGDGTAGNTGFSSAPWVAANENGTLTWSTETFAQNPNANAIRWGTMYNFRFDSNRPPQTVNATVGFFKTGAPITVQVQAPGTEAAATVSVSGRVTTADGRGIANARVLITDSNNVVRAAITSPFGYYRFDGVTNGATYNMAVEAKRYTFTPRSVPVNDNLTNVDFVAGS